MKKTNRYATPASKYWDYQVMMEDFINEYNAKYPNEKITMTAYEDQMVINGELKEFRNNEELLEFMAWTAVNSDIEDLLEVNIDNIFFDWEQGE